MRRDTQRDTQRANRRTTEQFVQKDDDPRSPRIQHLPIGNDERFYDHVCPTCGQKIDPSHQDHSALSRFTEESEAVGASRVGPAKWFTVALLSIIAAALFIGWREPRESGEIGGSGSAAEDLFPVTDIDPSEAAAPDTSDDSDAVLETRKTTALLELAALLGQHRIAYVANDDIVVVDPASVSDPVKILIPEQAGIEDLLVGFGSSVMFDEQGRTYGFKHDDASPFPKVYLLFKQGQVIAGENSSFALATGNSDSVEHVYVGNSSGLFMLRLEVPIGSELLNVPSLGVLVVSSTGETFITSQSGFAHFSDWPVIAANASHHVELRCSEPLLCTPVLVDRFSGAVSELPAELSGDSGNLTIAPDGNRILLINEDLTSEDLTSEDLTNEDTTSAELDRLYDVATGSLVALADKVGNVVAWSADSTFAAWFAPNTTAAQLWVLDLATAQIRSVDITDLGAPARTGSALILLP